MWHGRHGITPPPQEVSCARFRVFAAALLMVSLQSPWLHRASSEKMRALYGARCLR